MSATEEKHHTTLLTNSLADPNIKIPGLILSTDDVIFQVAQWLSPAEIASCRGICKQWSETGLHDNLWQWHCSRCFPNEIPRKVLNKYNRSYYQYYVHNQKIRFDGIYICHVVYYVQAEAALPSDEHKNYKICPYTKIEVYRYLRFLPTKQGISNGESNDITTVTVQTNKLKKHKNDNKSPKKKSHSQSSKHKDNLRDYSYDGCGDKNRLIRYASTKCSPIQFKHFECFLPSRLNKPLSNQKNSGPRKEYRRIYEGSYDVTKENLVALSIDTDYNVSLQMKLRIDETEIGRSDRLHTVEFFGVTSNEDHTIESIIDYPLRHEPYIFIPDSDLDQCMKYFEG